jgi:hypothetical protein
LKRKRSKKDLRILDSLELTKPKLRFNSTNIAMRFLTSLIANLSLRLKAQMPMFSSIK